MGGQQQGRQGVAECHECLYQPLPLAPKEQSRCIALSHYQYSPTQFTPIKLPSLTAHGRPTHTLHGRPTLYTLMRTRSEHLRYREYSREVNVVIRLWDRAARTVIARCEY